MEESISIAVDILRIFAGLYGLIAVSVLIYGIISVRSRSARIYGDEDSSYGFSKPLTVINSVIHKSVRPFYYHRTIPKGSTGFKGSQAVFVGYGYIMLGMLMLLPLIWAYIKFR